MDPDQRRIADGRWNDSVLRFALKTNASVLPLYLPGNNSLLFQLAGLVHPRMRTARLGSELLAKRSSTIEVRIGKPILASDLARLAVHPGSAMEHIRGRLYALRERRTAAAMARGFTSDGW